MDSSHYVKFLNQTSATDSKESKKTFYTIWILHRLFSSKDAVDCSRGDIINLPYQWHWVTPNPRHTIRFTKDGSLLTKTKPPKQYAKYKSYADIDRLPGFFFKDLLNPEPKYYSTCGRFRSFGWCSEREMAFVALLELLGYEGKVFSGGNHSYSEILVEIPSTVRGRRWIVFSVDNTFDEFTVADLPNKARTNMVQRWRSEFGDSPMAKWYNKKAHSKSEQLQIRQIKVHKKTRDHFYQSLDQFINTK